MAQTTTRKSFIMSECYCRQCSRSFKSLGIARHRAMHRDKKEVVTIVFNKTGQVITWDYRDK
jgi:hypothetical protein